MRLLIKKAVLQQHDTLRNGTIFNDLKNIIKKYKLPDADWQLLENALNEFRKDNSDLTLNEAIEKIKNTGQEAEKYGTANRVDTQIYTSLDIPAMMFDEYNGSLNIKKTEVNKKKATDIDKKIADIEIAMKQLKNEMQKNRADVGKAIEELKSRFAELQKSLQAAPQKNDLEDFEHLVEQMGEANGLSQKQIVYILSLYNKNLPYDQNVDIALKAISNIKSAAKPQGVPVVRGPFVAYIPASPFERSYHKGTEIPIPQECKIIGTYANSFEAEAAAKEIFSQDPTKIIAYAYDFDTQAWVVLECRSIPRHYIRQVDGVYLLKTFEETEE